MCGRHGWTSGLRQPWLMAVSYKCLSSCISIFRSSPVEHLYHLPCTFPRFIDATELGQMRKLLLLMYLKRKAVILRELDRIILNFVKDEHKVLHC